MTLVDEDSFSYSILVQCALDEALPTHPSVKDEFTQGQQAAGARPSRVQVRRSYSETGLLNLVASEAARYYEGAGQRQFGPNKGALSSGPPPLSSFQQHYLKPSSFWRQLGLQLGLVNRASSLTTSEYHAPMMSLF